MGVHYLSSNSSKILIYRRHNNKKKKRGKLNYTKKEGEGGRRGEGSEVVGKTGDDKLMLW